MKFIVKQVDIPNKNNRLYPRSVMQNAIDEYTKNFIVEKRGFLCGKQPETSFVSLMDVIGLIKSIEINDNNYVIADIQQINANNASEIWPLLYEKKLSITSAGMGTLVNRPDGISVVQDDFELISLFVTGDQA